MEIVFYTCSLNSMKLSEVQLNMSGFCQPPSSLSHILETFPCEPFGHNSLASSPNTVLGHQIPLERDLGQPS